MRHDNDCRTFDPNDELADMFTELDLHNVEPWSLEEYKVACDEIADALDKTLSQIIPLLCRKYKIGPEMIRLILTHLTMECSIALESGRLGLTKEEAAECVSRIRAVLSGAAEQKRRRIE